MDGEAVEFGTSGYTMDQVFVLYDRRTESVWYPLSAETLDAVSGTKRGEAIAILDEPAPVVLRDWVIEYPATRVLLPSEEDGERMRRWMARRAEVEGEAEGG